VLKNLSSLDLSSASRPLSKLIKFSQHCLNNYRNICCGGRGEKEEMSHFAEYRDILKGS